MEAMQLRNNFHQLIDSFSDVKMLEQLYEVISNFQAQKGKTVSHGEAKEKVKY